MSVTTRRGFMAALAATAILGAAPLGAFAQGYPDKPIRLIVPFPPGGAPIPWPAWSCSE